MEFVVLSASLKVVEVSPPASVESLVHDALMIEIYQKKVEASQLKRVGKLADLYKFFISCPRYLIIYR
jgi:hypothetical protein